MNGSKKSLLFWDKTTKRSNTCRLEDGLKSLCIHCLRVGIERQPTLLFKYRLLILVFLLTGSIYLQGFYIKGIRQRIILNRHLIVLHSQALGVFSPGSLYNGSQKKRFGKEQICSTGSRDSRLGLRRDFNVCGNGYRTKPIYSII